MTRISVLMPVKDGARWLPAALRSLARQSRPADEIVVVDDASADATYAVLSSWARRLPLKVVRGEGRGIARALNRGLAECGGELIARMDADDVSHPHRLAAQEQLLSARPDVGVCGTEVLSFPASRVTERRVAYDAWLSALRTPEEHARDIYVEAPICHPTACFRAEVLRAAGGYHDVPWPEDYDLWLRLHGRGVRMAKPTGVLHFWREGETRLSRRSGCYSLHAIRACRLHHLVQHFALRARGVVMVGAGLEGKAAARVLIGHGVTVYGHVDADPRKVGGRLMGEGGVRVWPVRELPRLMGEPTSPVAVVAIGTHGARPSVRAEMPALGLTEQVNAVVVA
ncbi:MAG: glycosyltransferase [Myxococcota bacterium]